MSAAASGQRVRPKEEVLLPFPFFDIPGWFFSSAKRPRRRPWTARRLFALAGRIAGARRASLRSDWSAVLAELPPHEAVRASAGMVVAALRLRAADVAQRCWRPADRVLASRTLSNMVVAAPTAAVMWILFRHSGEIGVLVNAEAIAVVGATFRGLIVLGRWWRDVAPPEREAQRRRG
ncbi:hypothetical protein ABH935_008502 [Catenulispora sp. GAS73]|uniref:hypothetical protein n=1 Tax=Catenulispora sp. GAS73 TaxID=3156269 RepID=UPI0035177C2C